jgi:L-rhamnose mutarotase
METYCLTLDLHDDPSLIAEYTRYHEPDHVLPEVIASAREQGIFSENIHLLGNRLVMVLQIRDDFSWQANTRPTRRTRNSGNGRPKCGSIRRRFRKVVTEKMDPDGKDLRDLINKIEFVQLRQSGGTQPPKNTL